MLESNSVQAQRAEKRKAGRDFVSTMLWRGGFRRIFLFWGGWGEGQGVILEEETYGNSPYTQERGMHSEIKGVKEMKTHQWVLSTLLNLITEERK